MDAYHKRFAEARLADDVRNKLIEDLLRKVDDMQKTMDRNTFSLVLIDGDGMNFLDDLIRKGVSGGDEASIMLRRQVFNGLRSDPDFRHDEKIIVKIYANMRGLNNTYGQHGLSFKPGDFTNFLLGFNKSHPLCDFVDSGNHEESAK